MCAQSQGIDRVEFKGTHQITQNIYHRDDTMSTEDIFFLDNDLAPYMEAYDQVYIEDDLIINEYGSSVPLTVARSILQEISVD